MGNRIATNKALPRPEPQFAGVLLPYQQRWVADRAPIKVIEKSRRIGISWCEAADAALTAVGHNGADVWYVGYNYIMAKSFIQDVAEWANRIDNLTHKISQSIWEKSADGHESVLAYSVKFASGHEVTALSSRPRSLRSRGRPGEVAIIDEAAMHDDFEEVLKAAIAFTMWGGHVHIISTHKGAESPFATLVNDIRAGRKNYSLHRVTIDDALDEGLFHAICRVTSQEYSEAGETAWRAERFAEYGQAADEELLVIPGAGEGVFLPSALIESAMKDGIPVLRWSQRHDALQRGAQALELDAQDWIRENLEPQLYRLDPSFMSCFGEDFGRLRDLTVIWPLQLTHDLKRKTPFLLELRNCAFEQQVAILFYLVDRLPRFIGGACDAGGNGQYLAEKAALRYGYRWVNGEAEPRVESVALSLDFYRNNFPKYKDAFESARIEIPRDDGILADHRMVRYEKGVARVPDERIKDETGLRHGDSAIAGLLAYYASLQSKPEIAYTTPQTALHLPGSIRDELDNNVPPYGRRSKDFPARGTW